MKLSTKTRYGARILIELALQLDQGAVQVSKIASRQKIPVKYLEQLLRTLKLAGIVKSVRGPKGGHLLAKDPDSISLGQIVRLFEGQTDLVDCISFPEKCDMASECLVRHAWYDATTALYEKLDGISIADLIDDNCKKPPGLPVCPVNSD
ncbi:MAG: Rrf2 family transcriptional regulator [Proteobacteria bacterium]|nr:Rrf2 family transcriptional regulator [Pseudomonadota bacterium]MBU1586063.1 Rrf2 family transcriptional regulator [Pseudomonadota bacterium]MBU2455645.1 Rrf2 family transcriptional regulator [Pseudomonadota bacterium]MBU2629761.1 Rrf2 family transcriptional regulator [Pseudomonadota bacterium]